ncbi:hypothetical protein BJ170DRAFT_597606 [Xylariales sp. AK1849]|nr:hypothetical protein BJ170DRAFT_597606 [Xylariales sp. AK1849]
MLSWCGQNSAVIGAGPGTLWQHSFQALDTWRKPNSGQMLTKLLSGTIDKIKLRKTSQRQCLCRGLPIQHSGRSFPPHIIFEMTLHFAPLPRPSHVQFCTSGRHGRWVVQHCRSAIPHSAKTYKGWIVQWQNGPVDVAGKMTQLVAAASGSDAFTATRPVLELEHLGSGPRLAPAPSSSIIKKTKCRFSTHIIRAANHTLVVVSVPLSELQSRWLHSPKTSARLARPPVFGALWLVTGGPLSSLMYLAGWLVHVL